MCAGSVEDGADRRFSVRVVWLDGGRGGDTWIREGEGAYFVSWYVFYL